jgi:hypothetical protein
LTSLSVTGNISGGNLTTGGILSVTGNANVGNIGGTNAVFTNIAGTLTTAAQTNITSVGTLGSLSVTGNISGGNLDTGILTTTGNVTASGNVSGNYLLGNGTFITGLSASKIFNGTSEANIGASGGNANITIGGVSNVAVFTTTGANITGTINATGNADVGNLGTSGNVTAGYFLGNGSQLTGIDATAIQNGTSNVKTALNGNVTVGVGGTDNIAVFSTGGANVTGYITATGNITGSYLFGNGSQLTGIDATAINNGSSNVKVTSSGGNVTISVGGTPNVAVVTTTGANIAGTLNVTGDVTFGGNLIDTGALTISTSSNGNITLSPNGSGVVVVNTDIRNGQANGVGNIGSSSVFFNTVFAKATSAQYADLAEMYVADLEYSPATVLSFGGKHEVTLGSVNDSRVAGVVSTNPSYIMNSGLEGEHVVAVALTGRVPCRVLGTVRKGDMMVSAGNGYARAEDNPRIGTVIGKALEDFDGDSGVIEVVVGRM